MILIVDDDPAMLELLGLWLKLEGYAVRTASNGQEALAILDDEIPCAMLVDLRMPVMSGAELRAVQQGIPSLSRVPFILVSGEDGVEQIARDLGVGDVVSKPFDPERLAGILAMHCPHAF